MNIAALCNYTDIKVEDQLSVWYKSILYNETKKKWAQIQEEAKKRTLINFQLCISTDTKLVTLNNTSTLYFTKTRGKLGWVFCLLHFVWFHVALHEHATYQKPKGTLYVSNPEFYLSESRKVGSLSKLLLTDGLRDVIFVFVLQREFNIFFCYILINVFIIICRWLNTWRLKAVTTKSLKFSAPRKISLCVLLYIYPDPKLLVDDPILTPWFSSCIRNFLFILSHHLNLFIYLIIFDHSSIKVLLVV